MSIRSGVWNFKLKQGSRIDGEGFLEARKRILFNLQRNCFKNFNILNGFELI